MRCDNRRCPHYTIIVTFVICRYRRCEVKCKKITKSRFTLEILRPAREWKRNRNYADAERVAVVVFIRIIRSPKSVEYFIIYWDFALVGLSEASHGTSTWSSSRSPKHQTTRWHIACSWCLIPFHMWIISPKKAASCNTSESLHQLHRAFNYALLISIVWFPFFTLFKRWKIEKWKSVFLAKLLAAPSDWNRKFSIYLDLRWNEFRAERQLRRWLNQFVNLSIDPRLINSCHAPWISVMKLPYLGARLGSAISTE